MDTSLPYPLFNVAYFVRNNGGKMQVFLGTKRASEKAIRIGVANKLLGFGGEFDPKVDRLVIDGVVREHGEEATGCQFLPEDVEHRARILIRNTVKKPLYLDYIVIRKWRGEPSFKAAEFTDSNWYDCDRLPENVMNLDKSVLPRIFAGKFLAGTALYDENMNLIDDRDIAEVPPFE